MKHRPCIIKRVFAEIAPYWHIGTSVVIIAIAITLWVGRVDGAVAKMDEQSPVIEEIRFNLRALMNHLDVPYVERER